MKNILRHVPNLESLCKSGGGGPHTARKCPRQNNNKQKAGFLRGKQVNFQGKTGKEHGVNTALLRHLYTTPVLCVRIIKIIHLCYKELLWANTGNSI